MPSTGTPRSKTTCGARGEPCSVTEFGPPDKMMPFGANSRMNASSTSYGWISEYTCDSRMRRAINWVTWEPKSRIRILSCMAAAGRQVNGNSWQRRKHKQQERGPAHHVTQKVQRPALEADRSKTDSSIQRNATLRSSIDVQPTQCSRHYLRVQSFSADRGEPDR